MKPTVLLGEAFGSNEARLGVGFVGSSGVELLRMLNEAGFLTLTPDDTTCISNYWATSKPDWLNRVWLAHPEVVRMNVFNLHPPGNRIEALCGPKPEGIPGYPALTKSKYVRHEYMPELERLADELVTADPNLIICLGNTPLWALAGTTGISKLRGTTRLSTHAASGFKLLPTYHPAAVLRQWELRPTTISDLTKAGRERAYPEIRRQGRSIWIEPDLDDIARFFAEEVTDFLSVDVETKGSRITCIGFAPNPNLALVVPFDDDRKKGRHYWATKELEVAAWNLLRVPLEDKRIRKLFQNGLYDLAFIWRSMGIAVRGATEDTMLCHHALQPEALKGLGFLGSIYADESAWKTERKGAVATIKKDA